MGNRKNGMMVKILCFVICFSFIIMAGSSMVFAKGGPIKEDKLKEDRLKEDISHGKAVAIQAFVLDSMESEKNKVIAHKLSDCTTGNISVTAKSIATLLKGSWDNKKGEAAIKSILGDYLGYTQKAKTSINMIIGEGFKGVVVSEYLSHKIRSKINLDITGNPKDDRGIKFMVKSVQILQKVASINDEEFVTMVLGRQGKSTIRFNRLENYPYVTSSITDVLETMQNLPFKKKNFQSFVSYYEKYLNSCSTYENVSFFYLLKDNNIPYGIELK